MVELCPLRAASQPWLTAIFKRTQQVSTRSRLMVGLDQAEYTLMVAGIGGAIALGRSTKGTLSNLLVQHNLAVSAGGGISCLLCDTYSLRQSQVTDNTGVWAGGGLLQNEARNHLQYGWR